MKTPVQLILFLLVIGTQARAGTTDLSIEFIADIADGVEIGEVGSFTLAVTNHGPDPSGFDSVNELPITVVSSPLWIPLPSTIDVYFQIDPDVVQDCVLFSYGVDPPLNTPPHYLMFADFPPLLAGQTATCQGIYTVGHVDPAKVVELRVRAQPVDTDPNPDNNTIAVVFGLPPTVVPVNAGYFLMALAVLLTWIAWRVLRSKPGSPSIDGVHR